jgi:hypothetical protein
METKKGTVMGEWAKACDARKVGGEEDHLKWAAVSVSQALVWKDLPPRVDFVVAAGARVRAHRREHCGWQGTRVNDLAMYSGDSLLWHALGHLVSAALPAAFPEVYLRRAEAALRTWWKTTGEAGRVGPVD